jgi:hypothetical protein
MGESEIRKRPSVALLTSINAIASQLNVYGKQQRGHERQRACRETIIIIGVIAAAFAGGSAWIFYLQLDEMRQEKRPWIDVSLEISSITADNDTVNADVVLLVRNVGRLPANLVFPVSEIVIPLIDHNTERIERHICDSVKERPHSGTVIFPKDPQLRLPAPTNLRPYSDFIKAMRVQASVFVDAIPSLGEEEKERMMKAAEDKYTGQFEIVSCIGYFIYGSTTIYRSGVIYNVWMNDPKYSVPISIGRGDIIPKEKLRVERVGYGTITD